MVFRLRISDNFFVVSEMYHKIIIWENVTKFGQNLIAPQNFLGWYGYGLTIRPDFAGQSWFLGFSPAHFKKVLSKVEDRLHVQTSFFVFFKNTSLLRQKSWNLRMIQNEVLFFKEHYFLGTDVFLSTSVLVCSSTIWYANL